MTTIRGYQNQHTIAGTVRSILFSEVVDGQSRSIFTLQIGKNTTHTVIAGWGLMREPERGEIWECTGAFKRHPKFGNQLEASEAVPLEPEDSYLAEYIALNAAFPGWGPDKARKLLLKVPKLKLVLNAGDHQQISERTGIGQGLCRLLVEQWQSRMSEVRVGEFLASIGVPHQYRQLLQGCYGWRVIERIRKDPYRLLAFLDWGMVDDIARTHLAVATDDPRRMVGAVEACLHEALTSGHMAMPQDAIERALVRKAIQTPWSTIRKLPQKAFRVLDNDMVQSVGCFALENLVTAGLNALAARSDRVPLPFLENLLAEFEAEKRKQLKLPNFRLEPEQVQAIRYATEHYLSLISGGAGTGKTTITKAIIHQHESRGCRVYLTAPTGRAARHMAHVTGHKAETLFRFNLRIKKRVRHGELQGCLIIIDEASMQDPANAYQLLKALPQDCRLCLIGDHRQLPPVSAGLVFHQLAKAKAVHLKRTKLLKAHRASLETGIPQVANAIRREVVPKTIQRFTRQSPEYGVYHLPVDVTDLEQMSRRMMNVHRHLLGHGEDVIMVTYNRATCSRINTDMQQSYLFGYRNSHNGKDPLSVLPHDKLNQYYQGEPVIYLKNDQEKDLSNGSFGTITKAYKEPAVLDGEVVIAEAEFEEGLKHLTAADFNRIQLAYCLSGHKAQGSQWDRVIIMLDNPRRIDNSWLYTAITRASQQVVIMGEQELINRIATSKPIADKRYLGTPIEEL
ncbi:AAA family ATPase [Photobacterium sanguinicancri]|uniref:AAA family ATPase n=1 Tax=Photobacterium sanguinicancri TaxID=875932 RepID=UPI003D0BCE74